MNFIKKLLSFLFSLIKIVLIPILVALVFFVGGSHLDASPIPAISNVSDFNYVLNYIGCNSNIPVVKNTLTSVSLQEYKSNSTFDPVFYPHYGMLNDEQKVIYAQFYDKISDMKKSFIIYQPNITQEEAELIWTSVVYDHPELFWSANECTFVSNKDGNNVLGAKLSYYNFGNIEKAKSDFENSANNILKELDTVRTNQGKEMLIHDKLVGIAQYDVNANFNQSAYSALVGGRSVCAGYSRAYQYLLTKAGIPCYYATGWSEENHAWNIVKIDDEFYNVDVTWDAALRTHSFFNRTDEDLAPTHTRTDLAIKLPVCDGETYHNTDAIPPIIVQ